MAADYDFIALVETWLSNDVKNSELLPAHYNAVRCDRDFAETNTTRGGGVLLAFKTDYNVEPLDLSEFINIIPLIDILGCKCSNKYSSLFIYVLYIPPRVTSIELELFFESFELLISNQKNILILGDFNVTHFVNIDLNDSKSQVIRNFLEFTGMNQVNHTLNVHGRLLDLVVTDMLCDTFREILPLIEEDGYHPAIIVNFEYINEKINKFPADSINKCYNFKKANFHDLYYSFLNTDWTFLSDYSGVDIMCDEFYKKIYSILDLHVPVFNHSNKSNYPIWYTPDIIRNLKLKSYYKKKFKRSNDNYYNLEFSRLRALIKRQIKMAYNNYLNNVERSISDDPKNFWSYVQNKKGSSRIPSNMCYNTSNYDNPLDIVNGFANYFSSVYLPKANVPHGINSPLHTNKPCINVDITENSIREAIKKLPNKMTSGHDQIPSFLVRDCMSAFIAPLLIIFSRIVQIGIFPDVWKLAKVCPVLKSGCINNIENYRPISILCNFAKVLEILLYAQIYPRVKPFISPQQYGFLEKRSTISNLAIINQFISDSLDNRGQVDVIYTDFAKAFDRIDHSILINKLDDCGFSNSLIMLFASYLNDRLQYVFYNGFKSDSYTATSGVPQGSNLGPLLFIIFINDLTETLFCGSLLFADDLKLFATVESLENCLELQSQIDIVQRWCGANNLPMNVSKCKVCSYTRRSESLLYNYTYDSISLIRCNLIKDLGILFDSKLSFGDHIQHIASSALKMLGFIIRNCRCFSNIFALKTLYFALVRSKLEYGSLVWYPHYDIHKNTLESVQRRFLKYIAFKSDGIYPVRGYNHTVLLLRFNISSLEHRRIVSSLVFLYKLLHNLIDSPALLSKICIHVPRVNTRLDCTFYCTGSRTNILIKSPVHIMCNNFNKICNLCDINHCSLGKLLQISRQYLNALSI